jgi:hypothetical protein
MVNKATSNAREAIARFVDGNADKLQSWLDQIAEEQGPMAAAKLFIDLIEYHVPKLARTEVANADDKPFQTEDVNAIRDVFSRRVLGVASRIGTGNGASKPH